MLASAATLLLLPTPLQLDLNDILKTKSLRGALIGVQVSKSDGEVLFEQNADKLLIPASNQKLLTAAYALDVLGPDYRPVTRFWKLADRIVVDSPGDPLLTSAQLLDIRQRLSISADQPVYVRQAYDPGVPPTWEWDDLPNRYAAPVTAFTVDRGGFELWAEKGKAFYLPRNYGARVQSLGGTGRPRVKYDPANMISTVRGKVPTEKTLLDTLAIARPDRAAGSFLGTPVLPAISIPTEPPTLEWQGASLAEILKECLPKSDNNIAEHLLLMASGRTAPLGDDPYADASERITTFLVDKVRVDPQDVKVADGSGLSRQNWITARGLAQVLRYEAAQPTFTLWSDALAKSGTGTLEKRLAGSTFRGKTGTLTGASSLSGYVTSPAGETLVVSMIMNNYKCPAAEVRGIQDQMVRRLEQPAGMRSVASGKATTRRPPARMR